MTTTNTPWTEAHLARVNAAAEAARVAADTITDSHGRDWSATSIYWRRGICYCTCGRRFTTHQGLGLHLAAIRRQADKAWYATYDESLAAN